MTDETNVQRLYFSAQPRRNCVVGLWLFVQRAGDPAPEKKPAGWEKFARRGATSREIARAQSGKRERVAPAREKAYRFLLRLAYAKRRTQADGVDVKESPEATLVDREDLQALGIAPKYVYDDLGLTQYADSDLVHVATEGPGKPSRYRLKSAIEVHIHPEPQSVSDLKNWPHSVLDPPNRTVAETRIPFTPETPSTATTAFAATSPSSLLSARRQVVPFEEAPRARELADLRAWCDSEARFGVRLFVGPGGIGKTRLFVEWVQRIQSPDWSAQLFPRNASMSEVATVASAGRSAFIALDYAAGRQDLPDLIRALSRHSGAGVKVRLALLEREAGGWWAALGADDDATISELLAEEEPHSIAPLAPDVAERTRLYHIAANEFATWLSRAKPSRPSCDLAAREFSRILSVHLAALADVLGLRFTPGNLLRVVVDHERRTWCSTCRVLAGERPMFLGRASRFVAAVVLRGGVGTTEEAQALLARVRGPEQPRFLDAMAEAYPGLHVGDRPPDLIAPIGIHLLGETIVATVLSDKRTPSNFLQATFLDANRTALVNGFTILGRMATDTEGTETSRAQRRRACEGVRTLLLADPNLESRALPCVEAAIAIGKDNAFSSLGEALSAVLHTEGTPKLATRIYPLIPANSSSLAEVGYWSAKSHLDATFDDESRAKVLRRLAHWHGILDRRADEYDCMESATRLYRRLVQTRPELRTELAASLTGLAISACSIGAFGTSVEAGREAVQIYRGLANGSAPSSLATSLRNLAHCLEAAGYPDAALEAINEAIAIRQRLPASAQSLLARLGEQNELCLLLSRLGRHPEAIKASSEVVRASREHARTRPDEFMIFLALSLNNLAIAYHGARRGTETRNAAGEGAAICRLLLQAGRTKSLPLLAECLRTLLAGCLLNNDLAAAESAGRESLECWLGSADATSPCWYVGRVYRSMEELAAIMRKRGHQPDLDPVILRARELLATHTKCERCRTRSASGAKPGDAASGS